MLVFGALLTPRLFADLPWQGYVAVVLAIVLIQAWFGPKGFESVVCMPFSIVAHSSTDVLIARMFDVEGPVGIPDDAHDTKTGEIEPERKAAL
ncbi:hypothetical protein [Streptomyces canus]|uniref:hypothetical protein n=1 Tax=Streptomyces canus TaxID=58343 RepID=UPI003F6D636E